jgi:hypothetical protein
MCYLPTQRILKITLRPTVNRPVCLGVKHPSGAQNLIFFYCQTVAGFLMWDTFSVERLICRLQFLLVLASTVILGPEYFTVSDSRLPKPGGPGPRIYIPLEQGGPVITPGTGFPFRRLLQLAGLRWRYSNPPPRGNSE